MTTKAGKRLALKVARTLGYVRRTHSICKYFTREELDWLIIVQERLYAISRDRPDGMDDTFEATETAR